MCCMYIYIYIYIYLILHNNIFRTMCAYHAILKFFYARDFIIRVCVHVRVYVCILLKVNRNLKI